ncbi:MAG: hypothetical protein HOW73_37110 [Polyangiaceae bacterium]|nr:hypothetical protein [Polyangiaceae bacterium]
MQRFALLSAVACAFAVSGCNSLTEPNQFEVVKEERYEAKNTTPGATNTPVTDGKKPGSVATPPSKVNPGTQQALENLKASVKAREKAPAAAPAMPAGGSCGE